ASATLSGMLFGSTPITNHPPHLLVTKPRVFVHEGIHPVLGRLHIIEGADMTETRPCNIHINLVLICTDRNDHVVEIDNLSTLERNPLGHRLIRRIYHP